MGLPASWTEALDRFAEMLSYDLDVQDGRAEAEEWLREVVVAVYGVGSLHDLDRLQRHVAFQKFVGVVLAVEDAGIPTEVIDGERGLLWFWYGGTIVPGDYPGEVRRRDRVARAFARYFDGVALEGPPWRLGAETDRPTYDEYRNDESPF